MNNFLYIAAVIILTLWMICFFIYAVGALVHVLLVLALAAVFFLASRENRAV